MNGISSATYTNPANNGVLVEDDGVETPARQSPSNKSKILPPIPRDFGATSPTPRSPSPLPSGAIDKEVFESLGHNSLSVRFDINIVKVCN